MARIFLFASVFGLALFGLLLLAAIVLGGPRPAVAMPSINEPFKALDLSELPPLQTVVASDGATLSHRSYAARGTSRGTVVLVHGSSASSASMHRMAQAFQSAGWQVLVPDIRGHGASGPKGDIDHIGLLEDDLVALLDATHAARPLTLVGFSAGGGFALRFAASARAERFDHYLLLSPFLGAQAPTYKAGAGWAEVGIPRILALKLLTGLGITAWNHLPVIHYALNAQAQSFLTPTYSYNLLANFGPGDEVARDIAKVRQPCAILAGADDELFQVDQFEPMVRAAGAQWPVRLIPQTGHVTLVLKLEAIAAAVDQVRAWSP